MRCLECILKERKTKVETEKDSGLMRGLEKDHTAEGKHTGSRRRRKGVSTESLKKTPPRTGDSRGPSGESQSPVGSEGLGTSGVLRQDHRTDIVGWVGPVICGAPRGTVGNYRSYLD